MPLEKFILIGCDDMVSLSSILNGIKGTTTTPYSIITATRINDLVNIVRSHNADIVILYFRNNQQAINDLSGFTRQSGIPLLCILRYYGNEKLQWAQDNIVFTCPIEQINKQESLGQLISSILLLKAGHSKPQQVNTAAGGMDVEQADSTRNLSRYVMELDQKAEILSKIKDRIAELYTHVDDPTRVELISIVNAIKMSANNNKLWDDFKVYFEQTDPNFLLLLAEKYPVLTPIDLKYCCYLKMNMSNDDIGHLLGINQESVRTHKYRLKKKMSLARDQDLRNYLRSVEHKKYQSA